MRWPAPAGLLGLLVATGKTRTLPHPVLPHKLLLQENVLVCPATDADNPSIKLQTTLIMEMESPSWKGHGNFGVLE